jgi:hypothetical protein
MEWNGMEWNGMDWTGLDWTGLDWTGLEWNGLDWTGMEWNGMDWTGMDWTGLEWTGLEWNGMDWNGMDWNGLAEHRFRLPRRFSQVSSETHYPMSILFLVFGASYLAACFGNASPNTGDDSGRRAFVSSIYLPGSVTKGR